MLWTRFKWKGTAHQRQRRRGYRRPGFDGERGVGGRGGGAWRGMAQEAQVSEVTFRQA